MPSFSSLATLSVFALGAVAQPGWGSWRQRNGDHCMTDAEAQQVITNWGTLIASYSDELANAALTENLTDYSESVNTLINSCPQGAAAITLPLLSPSFTNRTAFEVGQGQQPAINFNQLNTWHSCDTAIVRWETTNTANITDVKPVVGMIVLETVPAPAGSQFSRLIDTVYSEFDAGAWLQNLQEAGICAGASGCPLPDPSAPATASTTLGAPATFVPTPIASTNSASYSSWYASASSSWSSVASSYSAYSTSAWSASASSSTAYAHSTSTWAPSSSSTWSASKSTSTPYAYSSSSSSWVPSSSSASSWVPSSSSSTWTAGESSPAMYGSVELTYSTMSNPTGTSVATAATASAYKA